MNLEQSLRALADEDAAARVPPQVDAAVMAAWDASVRERSAGERLVRRGHWRAVTGWAIAGAIAVSLLAIAVARSVGPQQPKKSQVSGDSRPVSQGGVLERPVEIEATAAVVPAAAGTLEPLARRELPVPPKRARRVSALLPEAGAGYVLVPDAGVGEPLTMMRVRMSRSAFSRLGVPIANPDGDGLVDVDVLVGEDGVARSIRRAAAVDVVDMR